jgi:hypothetical protein
MIMKKTFLVSVCAFAVIIFLLYVASVQAATQNQEKVDPPKVSEGEAKAIAAFNAATDTNAKLTAAEEFVKKYPKSVVLPQLAQKVAVEIFQLKDSTQKLALADRFEKTFNDDKSLAIVQSARLDAYVASNRADEAFTLAATILTKDPEELHTLMQMTFSGTDEAKRGNTKYLQQSQQYGAKAIELIEANKKPANMDEASWTNHKAALPLLYQQTGILAMVSKNVADAKSRLAKAIELKPEDPSSHAILAYLTNNEYVDLASSYKAMPEGKEKSEMLVKLEAMIDSIIDSYARVVALSTGKPEYQALLQQVMPDLTSYYKYRHKSVEGLQQLIDKYKPQPAKP